MDAGGAEQLIGKGDMLISYNGEITRLQCAFVDTPEVEQVAEFIGYQENFPEHRSVEILRSIPGVGRVFIATVFSEAGRPLLDRDYHDLRLLAGAAPVKETARKIAAAPPAAASPVPSHRPTGAANRVCP